MELAVPHGLGTPLIDHHGRVGAMLIRATDAGAAMGLDDLTNAVRDADAAARWEGWFDPPSSPSGSSKLMLLFTFMAALAMWAVGDGWLVVAAVGLAVAVWVIRSVAIRRVLVVVVGGVVVLMLASAVPAAADPAFGAVAAGAMPVLGLLVVGAIVLVVLWKRHARSSAPPARAPPAEGDELVAALAERTPLLDAIPVDRWTVRVAFIAAVVLVLMALPATMDAASGAWWIVNSIAVATAVRQGGGRARQLNAARCHRGHP